MTWLLCLLIGIAIVVFIFDIMKKSKVEEDTETEEKEIDSSADTTKECPYYKALLLTKNEWHFYKEKLKPLADKYNLQVLTKVRMEDIVGVKKSLDKKERASARGKVRARHFDFVLTNQDLKVLMVIELDDRSHENEKAKKNDNFKDEVLKQIDLPYIRTKRNGDFENELCEKLKISKN